MTDKLDNARQRERIKLTASVLPLETRQERDLAAFARSEQFVKRQNDRVLAEQFYLQEVAEKNDVEDGRYLTQVLERLSDELRVLLIRGSSRELALVLTSLEQAEHWAIAHGRKTNSHIILDRRIFKVDHTEDVL